MTKSIEKIIITGGSGFIGTNVIDYFIAKENVQVINIDCITYAGNEDSNKLHSENKNYFFEKTNICDINSLEKIFKTYQPTKVLHLAAESHVDRSIDSPIDFINTNVIGTYNLLEVSRKYLSEQKKTTTKNFKFHHVSTDEVYGDLEKESHPFKETNQYLPSSPYSASKASSDHLVRAWHRTFDLPSIITNCSNNYGPFQYPEKLIPLTIINALLGRDINVYGEGDQIRDWLYVEDHAAALWEVLNHGELGEVYNIGAKNEIKNLDVVSIICKLLDEYFAKSSEKESFSKLIKFVKDRPGHDKRYSIDSGKINKSLGWMPKESFESGIRKTILWYLDNEWWWKKDNLLNNSSRLGILE